MKLYECECGDLYCPERIPGDAFDLLWDKRLEIGRGHHHDLFIASADCEDCAQAEIEILETIEYEGKKYILYKEI